MVSIELDLAELDGLKVGDPGKVVSAVDSKAVLAKRKET